MSTGDGFNIATSLLLRNGWKPAARGPIGELWAKDGAETPVAFDLKPGTLGWRVFLSNIAHVEGVSADLLTASINTEQRGSKPRAHKVDRAEMDLHLAGGTVRNHETSADDLGKFITATAKAVGELVALRTNGKQKNRLQIVGPRAGSVRVLFREPDVNAGPQAESLIEVPALRRTAEAGAMLELAQIMNAADDAARSPANDQLDAMVAPSPGVRRALGALSKVVYDSGWRVNGLMLGYPEKITIGMSLAGAHRLRQATNRTEVMHRSVSVTGTLDAWSWSRASMTLLRDGERPMHIAVPLPLASAVVDLLAKPKQDVEVHLDVYETHTPTGQVLTRSYQLTNITAANLPGV